MAKWTVTPGTTGNNMSGAIEYDGGVTGESRWSIYQDETPYLEQAKLDREQVQKKDTGYKKFATIPDIVAIDVKERFGVDIHSPTIMHDKDRMAKFMLIIKQEYPHLLSY